MKKVWCCVGLEGKEKRSRWKSEALMVRGSGAVPGCKFWVGVNNQLVQERQPGIIRFILSALYHLRPEIAPIPDTSYPGFLSVYRFKLENSIV